MDNEQPDIFKEPVLLADKRNVPLSIVATLPMLYLLYLILLSGFLYTKTAITLWRMGFLSINEWITPAMLLVTSYMFFRSIIALIKKNHERAIVISIAGIVLFYTVTICVTFS